MIEELKHGVRRISTRNEDEISSLLQLSARLGAEPLLVQASTGNASIKLDGLLWIKASGQWLADARERNILMPVELGRVRQCMDRDQDIGADFACPNRDGLRPSIETSMHAVLPHRVVIHVHSINTIAFAVQQDGPSLLACRLAGMRWAWVPYAESGLPLAREIQRAMDFSSGSDIFILANHGIVIGAEDCEKAEELLREVERRLAVTPRRAPDPEFNALESISSALHWCVPAGTTLHALGSDAISRSIVMGGVLYPCQAIFFGPCTPVLRYPVRVADIRTRFADFAGASSFVIVEGCGVIVNGDMTQAESAMLTGLAQIVQRIGDLAQVRYLEGTELMRVLTANTGDYRGIPQKTVPSFSSPHS